MKLYFGDPRFYSTGYRGRFGSRAYPSLEQVRKSGTGISISGRQKAFASNFRIQSSNRPNVAPRQLGILNINQIQETASDLKKARHITTMERKVTYGERFLQERYDRFSEVERLLERLRQASGEMIQPGSLNTKTVSSSDKSVIKAVSAKSDALEEKFKITVHSLAENQQVASGDDFDPSEALNLSGTVKINGYETIIEVSDSLASIAAKINYGEDTNINGSLDKYEDINGNGSLDTIDIPAVYTGEGYTKPVYYKEDRDGDSIIDTAEDSNGNEAIDGGSSQTKVRALIIGAQLVLVSENRSDIEISIQDPNNILERIGVLFRNPASGVSAVDEFNKYSRQAAEALVSINGKEFSFPENLTADMIAGVTLELKKIGTETVTITSDPDRALPSLLYFAATYNDSISFLNLVISGNGAVSKNIRLQSLYGDTVRSLLQAPPEKIGPFTSIADIGISLSKKGPTAIRQTTFENLLAMQKGDSLALPGAGPASLTNVLNRMGLNDSDNFNIKVDKKKFGKNLLKNSDATTRFINYSVGNLNEKLNLHLNKEYGTIRFQQYAIDAYKSSSGKGVAGFESELSSGDKNFELEQRKEFFSLFG